MGSVVVIVVVLLQGMTFVMGDTVWYDVESDQ
jgi:hypothetical protein